ncbi:hypothetical protein F8388_011734 [Cannabis sativa]|uniref:Reverse transcriptase zinc-binding domain-containing protein n=1 Tax=Cannabis sativa TaxID=3483 RepID=A0A7J6FGN0_CANSA|nr:hypothetical protein F8388_011734 [Cannabis sativa]
MLGHKILSLRDSLDETTLRQATRGNKFSAKRCYNLFVEESQAVNAGAIWDKLVVPKHRFIYWQIFNTHLLTRDYLQQILVIPSNLCPVFAAVNKWMGNFQWPRSIEEMVRGCCNLKKNLTDRIINTVLAAALYFLWKSRNKCIFDLSCLTPSCLSLGIKDTVRWRLISKGPFKDCKRNKYLLNVFFLWAVAAGFCSSSRWFCRLLPCVCIVCLLNKAFPFFKKEKKNEGNHSKGSSNGQRPGSSSNTNSKPSYDLLKRTRTDLPVQPTYFGQLATRKNYVGTLHAPCVVEDRLAILLQSYAGVELFLKGNVPVLLLNNDSRTLAYVTFGMMQVLLIYFW